VCIYFLGRSVQELLALILSLEMVSSAEVSVGFLSHSGQMLSIALKEATSAFYHVLRSSQSSYLHHYKRYLPENYKHHYFCPIFVTRKP
jgi:hypothetical protein